MFLGPNLVSWSLKKHTTVSRSTTEAEYRSLASTVAEIQWIQSLLGELRVLCYNKPLVHCDNLSVVLLTANPVLHARTKHLELDLFFVREKVQRRQLMVQHISSYLQVADGLTKPLSGPKFHKFRNNLRVVSSDDLRLKEDNKEKE